MTVKISRKQNAINLLMNIVSFCVQFLISFYVSPIIVRNIGAAANGFVGMASDFISYLAIITTIFNSVASRFIANAFYKKDFETANNYFNSLIVTNFFISVGIGLIGLIIIPRLNYILSIPVELIIDVKITFAISFVTYIVSLLTLVFTTSVFVSNRTDIQGIRNIVKSLIRFTLIIVFLNFISVQIYWISIASLVATIVVAIMNVRLTKKLTPEIIIDIRYAKSKYVMILAKSGCWMAVNSLSAILLRGLDLLVANIVIGDYEMGILSISRSIPNTITSIITTLATIFTPMFISHYSLKNTKKLVNEINHSIKILVFILYVPLVCYIIFIKEFYTLWQGSLTVDEIKLVSILSILTVVQAFFNSSTSTLAQLSVVTNKLKLPVIVSLGCGVLSLIGELILIKCFRLGLVSIVISTTVIMITRYVFFNPVYAAKCIGVRCTVFYKEIIKLWCSIPMLILLMSCIKQLFSVHSWTTLVISAGICCLVGYVLMFSIFGRDIVKEVLHRIKGIKSNNG